MKQRLKAWEAKVAQDGRVLTEAPLAALERAQGDKEAHGEFERECPGSCGAQDTFSVGTLKGVGRIDQQTFIDPSTKVGFAKRYLEQTPVMAAELLNDRVLPFFAQHEIPLSRVRSDRGTAYCGQVDRHPYELYLGLEDIDHSRTKTTRPQTNGICERFNKTLLNEFCRVVCRKRLCTTLDDLQVDLDGFLTEYNGASLSRPLVRWEDADANVLRQSRVGEGEADCVAREHADLLSQSRRAPRACITTTVRSDPGFHPLVCPCNP